MMKIITIGGGCQDIYMHFAGADTMSIRQNDSVLQYLLFLSGQKIEAHTLTYLTGGGATNAAVSFSRLGFNAQTFCLLGNDRAGKYILEKLTDEQVGTSLIQTSLTDQTGTSFIIKSINGERTILVHRGANSYLDLSTISDKEISKCNHLYITSLSSNATKQLPSLVAQAKKHNVPVAINPGTSQLKHDTVTLKESLKNIDILILNSTEAQAFMLSLAQSDDNYKKLIEGSKKDRKSCTPNREDETPYLMETLLLSENFYFNTRAFFNTALELGPRIVVVTNGCNGVYAATQEKAYFHPALKIDVVDNVGAGDSFGSCFVGSLLMGNSIEEALRNGVVNSASVLSQIGAKLGLLTHDELKRRSGDIKQNLIKTFSL